MIKGLLHLMIRVLYFLQAIFLKNGHIRPRRGDDKYDVVFRKARAVDICHCLCCGLYWANPIFKFSNFAGTLYETVFGTQSAKKGVPRRLIMLGHLPADYPYIINALKEKNFWNSDAPGVFFIADKVAKV
ncbi:MAG: hypothetical protein A2Z72_00645 [Omnitrophica bacterium RBG_13_46_9]|nr:MAG: hypothetical protein A2Z72_00645 [Omnitrophica bacterium RBG_13_46_9]